MPHALLRPGTAALQPSLFSIWWQYLDSERRSRIGRAIDALSCFVKVFGFGGGNIDEALWVAVHQWKPCALDLHHQAMIAAEGVKDVGNRELDFCDFARFERLWFFKAVAE